MSFEIERFIMISGLWPTIPHIDAGEPFPIPQISAEGDNLCLKQK